MIVVDLNTIGKLDGKENRMFDFVSDVGCSNVVVKALGVIPDDYLILTLTFVLSLYELLFQSLVSKGFNEGTKFFLLIVTGGPSRVNKNRRA